MSVKRITHSVRIDTSSTLYCEQDRDIIRREHMKMLKYKLFDEAEKYIELETIQEPSPYHEVETIQANIYIASEEDYRRNMGRHEEGPTPTQRLNRMKEEIKRMLVGMEAGKWLGPNDVKALREKLERLTF